MWPDEAAGARLGDGERPPARRAGRGRRRRRRCPPPRRRRASARRGAHLGGRALAEVARGGVRGGAGEDLHLDLREVRAVADGRPGEGLLDAREPLAHEALGQAEGAQAQLEVVVRTRGRGCAGRPAPRTCCFISRGTPGRKYATHSPTRTPKPGAVPTGLGRMSAPSGKSACLALLRAHGAAELLEAAADVRRARPRRARGGRRGRRRRRRWSRRRSWGRGRRCRRRRGSARRGAAAASTMRARSSSTTRARRTSKPMAGELGARARRRSS